MRQWHSCRSYLRSHRYSPAPEVDAPWLPRWQMCCGSAVQRELARLESCGLVTVRRIGNQKHYQANHDAPIFPELRSIVLKTPGVAEVLRDVLQPLWKDIQLAFVYGSLAKVSEHAGSDVDLIVIGALPSNAALLETLLPAQARLGRTVNPTYYTPEEFAQRVWDGTAFITRVLEQSKIFVKGSEHEISSLGNAGKSGTHRQTEDGGD